ncbi:MAG: C45 family peptidase [Spirochaetes bacterium]|jgi:predicted choloylglycine hydrolase|nr:C45 family peptidase [Spirochaetota bacterium]
MYLNIFKIFFAFSLLILPVGLKAGIISESRMMGLPEEFYREYVEPIMNAPVLKFHFSESTHRGSYRDIGRSQARSILKRDPVYMEKKIRMLKLLSLHNPQVLKINAGDIRKRISAFFPAYLEEVEGFAEVMKIDGDLAMVIYGMNFGSLLPGCSMFAVSRERSGDGGIIVGRNYDWSPALSDLSVVSIAPNGGFASVGLTELNLGRLEGINEKGLYICMAGSPAWKKDGHGFFFALPVRAVLDRASDVNEAVGIIRQIPSSDGRNYLIADSSGNAAVVEAAPGRDISVRRLSDSPDGILIATNHFQSAELKGCNSSVLPNSYERLRIIRKRLGGNGKILESDADGLLRKDGPEGVFWKNYGMLFGTIHSSICRPESGKLRVKAGGNEKTYAAKADIDGYREVEYENREANVLDYISTSGFNPVDLDSFYFRAGLGFFYSGQIINPGAVIDTGYKKGIGGSEKIYGSNIDFGMFINASVSFLRSGVKVSINPFPLVSIEASSFYCQIYPGINRSGVDDGSLRILRKINGLKNVYGTPGISINPVLKFGGILTFENKITFYDFQKRYYEYESNLLVRKGPVWSPSIEVFIPYSRYFLWGFRIQSNVELSAGDYRYSPPLNNRWNMNVGPVLAFPKIFYDSILYINAAYWTRLSEGTMSGRFMILAAVRCQI